MDVRLAKDTIDSGDIDYLIEWLQTYPRLTKGDVTLQFEEKWSRYLGVNHSVFVNSGSSANLLMLYTLFESGDLSLNDKVVVPAVSWSTDLAPVFQLGLDPILCDCNLENLSVDLNHLEDIFKKHKPKVLILVSVLGMVPDMSKIVDLCDSHGVILLEDTCESLGSEFEGKKLGSFGKMSSFSTYFGHHISTIEGGMVCTNDEKTSNILRACRSHGWSRDMDKPYQDELFKKYNVNDFNSMYTFYYSGFNLRSTDLQAYLGLRQLDKLPQLTKVRKDNYDTYRSHVKNDFWSPPEDSNGISNFAYPVIHKNRKNIVKILDQNGVENRPLICGSLGRQPYWIEKKGLVNMKNADTVHDFGMYLPNHGYLDEETIIKVSNLINKGIRN